MAKRREDLAKLTLVIPFKKPDKPSKPKQVRIFTPTCGCGAEAEYEVYDIRQPHCKSCMLEAMTSSIKPFVREIGGFDDAS
ncbi:hypothetical protein D3C81_174210 [compost metagenome]